MFDAFLVSYLVSSGATIATDYRNHDFKDTTGPHFYPRDLTPEMPVVMWGVRAGEKEEQLLDKTPTIRIQKWTGADSLPSAWSPPCCAATSARRVAGTNSCDCRGVARSSAARHTIERVHACP